MKQIIIIVSILFIGCKEECNSFFSDNVNIASYGDVNRYNLSGKIIIDDHIGLSDIEIIGDYLLFSTSLIENKFYLYSNNGHKLLEFGQHGEGPNDFINTRITGEKGIDYFGNAFIWINDVSMAKLKKIVVSKTCDSINCHIEKCVQTLPMSPNSFYVNDSLVLSEVLENGVMSLRKYNPVTNRITEEIKLYNKKVKHPFNFYKGISRFDKKRNILTIGMHSVNQINILDLNKNDRRSCLIGKQTLEQDAVDSNTGIENMTYYSDLRMGEQKGYALYLNQNYDDAYEIPSPVEIHVINNNIIEKIYSVKEYIQHIAVDETNNCIYGLSGDSAVYKYEL
ncbi:MAG: hypothetical protein J6A02_07890 [Prevotella sp.]|nr:hypothetical protein [Prevotella sp.]